MEIEKRSGEGIDCQTIDQSEALQVVGVSPMVAVDSVLCRGEVVTITVVDTEVKAEIKVDEVEIENRSGDGIDCETITETDDSLLVGISPMVTFDSGPGGGEVVTAAVDAEVKAEVNEGSVAKRKRGRPPSGQPRPPPMKKMKNEDEDVCFICFDGGSLVLCDRRGCPKAYHPACIKRDEAFFRSKAKWNCGWHICSICQKAAHYMCYTCTYSLCKACSKEADYVFVRESEGFCTLCIRTIMLIENNDQGNKEMPQVDFDDKGSWEYLFKIYWIYLKEKLSLTLDELTRAKNPWKATVAVACKKSLNLHYGVNDSKSSIFDIPVGHPVSNDSKRRAVEQPKLPNNGDTLTMDKLSRDEDTTSNEPTDWASKDLLEFVAHMKNGDTSALSEFDVQSLLLDYIRRNNLRDPSRKSQIICDLRLKNLFGKQCVGHFEMLKLLEFHFHTKEDIRKGVIQDNIIDDVLSQVEFGGNNENPLMGKDKKRKNRTRGEGRGPQINLDEYAAINVHNINLIYLRRNLMESLVVDSEKFHEKAVGSIVRIRISNNDQKQDMYRLVQVVGTSKAAVPYKIGKKTADFVLEILNLDKKETISIDVISNQALSEDECRRLRQSIKCGLVKRLTIGQVQKKAVALQEVRLDDWLETEVLRLNHLRDRASEKGHKKGLRECIEKLELLKTPEERQRKLHKTPEVHADPNMDPNCNSDEDAGEADNKKQGEHVKPRFSVLGRKRRESISAQNGDSQNSSGTRVWKGLNTCGESRILSTRFYLEKGAASRVVQGVHDYEGKDSRGSNSWKKPDNGVDSSCSVVGGWNNQAVLGSGSTSGRAPETSISSFLVGSASSADDSETEKLWHYRDPNGKIQGPFCMVQLRKWSTTGYFPPEMRIWSTNNEEVDSFLLTDVLNGKFHKVFPLRSNISLPSQGVTSSGSRLDYCDDRSSGSMNTTDIDGKWSDQGWNSSKIPGPSNWNNESVKGDGWGSQSSNWTAPVSKTDGHTGSSQFSDSLKFNLSSLHQGKEHEGKRGNPASNHGNWTSHENTACQTRGEQSHENQSDTWGYPRQSSGGNRRPLPTNLSSNDGDSNSDFASVARSSDSSEPKFEIDISNLPSPTPKTSNENIEGQAVKAQPSVPLSLPVQDSGLHKLPSPTQELSYGDEKVDSNIQNLPSAPLMPMDGNKKIDTAEDKLPDSSKFPVQNSGSSWSTASSLVVGGERHCRETADEWGVCSPTRTKPSVEEGDSCIGSGTSLKPHELANDHTATPTSKCDQFDTPSPKCDQLTPSSSGERRCREAADEWGGCSPTCGKPSVEEGDSGLGSVTSLKPCELANDHTATPTSKCDQLTPSPSDERRRCEAADEWGGCSPTRAKLSVEEGDSGLGSVNSLKPPELANDHAATPTSKCDQLTPSSPKCDILTPSPSHPTFNESTWHLEPIEFSTLDEESVSDLLAEVDAMESQCGLASPSSVMYSGDELFEDPNNDCFTSLGVLSRPLNSGRSDATSSTGDIILPHQFTMIDEPLVSHALDLVNSYSVKSSTSFEVNVLTQPTNFSVNKTEAGTNSQTDTSQRGEQKPMNPSWGTIQGHTNLDLGGINNVGWRAVLETTQGNTNMNWSTSSGLMGSESFPVYDGERFVGPRDWKSSWSRQSTHGDSGGSGGKSCSRTPPKGERVCQVYLSGNCKNGAFCDDIHP